MWKRNKRLAAFLAVTTSLQVVAPVPVVYASAGTRNQVAQVQQGSVTTNIQFDYPVTFNKVKSQNLQVSLLKDGKAVLKIALGKDNPILENKHNYKVDIVANNQQGVPLTTETNIGSYSIKIQGVDQGTYTLKYEGDGYTTYETKNIILQDYSKDVTVHTGQETFSYGDISGDGQITIEDLEQYKNAVLQGDHTKDLSGDGKVDITELTYITDQLTSKGDEVQRDTSAILSQKVIEAVDQGIKDAGLTIENGSVSDLLTGGSKAPITIKKQDPASEEPLEIPINLGEEAVETQVLEIVSPIGNGGLESGAIEVSYEEDGEIKTQRQSFDNAPSTYGALQFASRNSERNSIVIDLGKRVPVKKVTIVVDKVINTEGNADYVVLEEVNFIKDILPDGPIRDESVIGNVQLTPGDKAVILTWNPVNNVEGYRVYYGTEPGKYTQELNVSEPTAVVEGLENLKTYYFAIRAVSGDWMGTMSKEYQAVPQPSKPPKKPDFLNVEPMDRALQLSWKAAEDATYYKVFYKKATEETYTQFMPSSGADGKVTGTSVAIGGLENGVEYNLYVIAGNKIGESGQSLTVSGTPKKVTIDGPILPTKNRIPSSEIENIVMAFPANVAQEFYPNGFETTYNPNSTNQGLKNLVDGDFGTHWTARRWWESKEFTFTFKTPKEMDYLAYVGRIDGLYRKSLNHYTIKIWEENDNLNEPAKTVVSNKKIKRFTDENNSEYAILEFPKRNVKKISVEVSQWDGSPTNVSASEIVFYEYDSLDSEIRALFKDDSFTTLAEGVNQDKINDLRSKLNAEGSYYVSHNVFEDELNLAQALLDKEENALGIIKNEFVSIDAAGEPKVSSTWSPLGIVAGPATQMTIYADIPAGETLEIIPTQYYAEAGKFTGTPIELTSGRNVITIPTIHNIAGDKGGALYYRYTGDKGDQIKLQIRDITTNAANKLREIPTLELYNWYDLEEGVRKEKITAYVEALTAYVDTYKLANQQTNPYNATEISGRNVLLSLPADQILAGLKEGTSTTSEQVEKLYNSLLAWEEVMSVVHTTYGLDNPNHVLSSRQNIRYMRMFGSAFMYAAGNHIGIGYGSASALVQGEPTSKTHPREAVKENKLFGWGIGHEIGHNMDRIGKAEITNNIYSLMLQTYDGKDNILPSRLELSNKYEEMYKKVAIGDKGLANDVFTQLGMYWQLHLAYDEGAQDKTNGPLSFYNKLFKLYDQGAVAGFSGDDKFAVAASQVVGKDLTEFFTKWGMDLSQEAKAAMGKHDPEERKIQYLTDESRRQRLQGQEALSNIQVEVQAKVVDGEAENNKNVAITIQAQDVNPEDLLGYEIFRNGKQIAFITGTTYEDVIGSANNKVFSYEVRAIDILGNVASAMIDAGDVRIEHDNVIPSSAYTTTFVSGDQEITTGPALTTTGPAIVMTFDKQTPVTGIKVVGNPEGLGNFKVEVGTKDGKGGYTYRVAKEGDFSKNDAQDRSKFINYFNKPGAVSSDTRIWTYDADVIRITGEEITESFLSTYQVMPLGYPGDNVAFEDYKMAIMAHNYGEDETGAPLLPKGTLVVVGSYRGNPVHNIIHIKGKFMTKQGADDTDNIQYEERPLNGDLYMFAEVPEDGETSAISDGFFIFVPDIQKEAELQGHIDCSATSVLPTEIMAEMYYVDDPTNSQSSRRVTSQTLWYSTPSYESMPELTLQNSARFLGQEAMYELK
nr:M60 family metallopeptidase [uncultured Niameybacter sp.]